ncbi:hypothetical protein [Paenibacillus endoradicis]|uniref:hypothetical protein n=1 Tax=Paenibacillus endoradicis TaxID=2972487 RepID=UPI00215900EA|nr:hypothetical protein [Paenibacillus endoradicis]MCR8656693.1 hypothetical protein [Paenibacillus endoradicis]
MTKKFQTKTPTSMYFQLITFSLLALFHLRLALLIKENTLLFIIHLIFNLALVSVILGLLAKILMKNNQLEIMDDKIKLNNVEVSIDKIEKIIIQGYFIQSLGIKLYGKKFILNDLHFRFKNNEDMNIEDFKKWADKNGINITSERIKRRL